eukprot:497621-Alexandrium_andersonii.AAC.1
MPHRLHGRPHLASSTVVHPASERAVEGLPRPAAIHGHHSKATPGRQPLTRPQHRAINEDGALKARLLPLAPPTILSNPERRGSKLMRIRQQGMAPQRVLLVLSGTPLPDHRPGPMLPQLLQLAATPNRMPHRALATAAQRASPRRPEASLVQPGLRPQAAHDSIPKVIGLLLQHAAAPSEGLLQGGKMGTSCQLRGSEGDCNPLPLNRLNSCSGQKLHCARRHLSELDGRALVSDPNQSVHWPPPKPAQGLNRGSSRSPPLKGLLLLPLTPAHGCLEGDSRHADRQNPAPRRRRPRLDGLDAESEEGIQGRGVLQDEGHRQTPALRIPEGTLTSERPKPAQTVLGDPSDLAPIGCS